MFDKRSFTSRKRRKKQSGVFSSFRTASSQLTFSLPSELKGIGMMALQRQPAQGKSYISA